MSHNTDALGSAVSEQQRHADLHVLGSHQEAEETRTGVVGAESFAGVDALNDGSLTDRTDVNRVLESLFDALDTWMLNYDDRRLQTNKFISRD